jgi:hypothetical protein
MVLAEISKASRPEWVDLMKQLKFPGEIEHTVQAVVSDRTRERPYLKMR